MKNESTGLGPLLRFLAEERRTNPLLAPLEHQARILSLIESRGRAALRAREIYRQLHLKREEFDRAVAPLVKKGFLGLERGLLSPRYTDLEPVLAYLDGRIRRLEGLAGPIVAAPSRALAVALFLLASTLGALALVGSGLFPAEPPLQNGLLLAGDGCAGFGIHLGQPGSAEVQLERGGGLLAGGAVDHSGTLYVCKGSGGFRASATLPPRETVPLASPGGDPNRYLLVNATVRGRGSLTELLIADFREDNRLDLAPEWAIRLDGGLLVGARNAGRPLEGVFLLYRLNPDSTLSPLGRSGPISLGPGERVAFAVPAGVSYAVLTSPAGDGYARLNVTGPFGEPGLPPVVRVG